MPRGKVKLEGLTSYKPGFLFWHLMSNFSLTFPLLPLWLWLPQGPAQGPLLTPWPNHWPCWGLLHIPIRAPPSHCPLFLAQGSVTPDVPSASPCEVTWVTRLN